MNEREFERLKYIETNKVCVRINDLTDRSARTLLFGYDKDGWRHHTYIEWQGDDPVIRKIVYLGKEVYEWEVDESEDYVPNKRLYPQACDAEFCELLIRSGIYLPFTSPDWSLNDGRVYYGKRIGELT